MREEFENILEEHGIFGEDVEEIIYAVSDMLNFAANKTKEEEPYAVNTIEGLKWAEFYLVCLINEL